MNDYLKEEADLAEEKRKEINEKYMQLVTELDQLAKENRSYKDEVDTLSSKVGEYRRECDDLKTRLDSSGNEVDESKSKVRDFVIMIPHFGFDH